MPEEGQKEEVIILKKKKLIFLLLFLGNREYIINSDISTIISNEFFISQRRNFLINIHQKKKF